MLQEHGGRRLAVAEKSPAGAQGRRSPALTDDALIERIAGGWWQFGH